ncbi:hypothetical protein CPC08DRAFT_114394 [Agrocybe pediades]|nr:hypothetical protein CPC08DRAFT_114394 [Agrocybe pediades]
MLALVILSYSLTCFRPRRIFLSSCTGCMYCSVLLVFAVFRCGSIMIFGLDVKRGPQCLPANVSTGQSYFDYL